MGTCGTVSFSRLREVVVLAQGCWLPSNTGLLLIFAKNRIMVVLGIGGGERWQEKRKRGKK